MTKHKQLHGLYVITDPQLCKENLVEKVEQAIIGGARIIQYRNKQATPGLQREEAISLNELCRQYQCLFIVNDNVELAKNIDADGVHIGQSDVSLQAARQLLGEEKIIGVSCNNQLQWAINAQQAGADYVAFGRFYPSQTKPQAPQAEPALLQQAKAELTIPVVAIGGITPENADALLEAGADMLAVIHAIFAEDDVAAAARKFPHQVS